MKYIVFFSYTGSQDGSQDGEWYIETENSEAAEYTLNALEFDGFTVNVITV